MLGWLARPDRLRRYAGGILSSAEIRLLNTAYRSLDDAGLTIADVALLDELDALLGKPMRPARAKRDPFQLAGGVRELSTLGERQRPPGGGP
ncbi:hypothetical protein GCM10027614_29610 [Micromonospora vulcania]